MDIHALTASQLAYIIRLSVFMDNHQTQGNWQCTEILDIIRNLPQLRSALNTLRHISAVL